MNDQTTVLRKSFLKTKAKKKNKKAFDQKTNCCFYWCIVVGMGYRDDFVQWAYGTRT